MEHKKDYKKTLIWAIPAILILSTILSAVLVFAKPNFSAATNTNSGISVFVPEHAVQVAENVFSLGHSLDADGRVVEGFMFVDNRRENAKPPWAGGGKKDSGSTCYALLARGARWKTTEPYLTDFNVDAALTETSLSTWDSEVSFEIFGQGSSGSVDGADDASPDGKNEVMFENLGATSTIAYTIVWGIFRGPPQGRELIEWDAVFNSAYAYGDADVDSSVMDYQNIATHEFGHALGLGHPDDGCTEETMYRYADYGETKKRTLEAGDVAGVNELY